MVVFVLCPSGCRRSGGAAVVEGDEALDFSYVAKVEFRKRLSSQRCHSGEQHLAERGGVYSRGWDVLPVSQLYSEVFA